MWKYRRGGRLNFGQASLRHQCRRSRQTSAGQDCRRVRNPSPSAANRIRSLQTTQHAALFASPFAAYRPANPVRYDGKGGFPHDFDRVLRGRSRHRQTG